MLTLANPSLLDTKELALVVQRNEGKFLFLEKKWIKLLANTILKGFSNRYKEYENFNGLRFRMSMAKTLQEVNIGSNSCALGQQCVL